MCFSRASENADKGVGHRVRISIVDDDKSVREAVEWFCTFAGYHAESYDSAEAFLRARRIELTDCLIVSLQLPGKSGLELQNEILATHKQLPVVIITGRDDVTTRNQTLENGAIAFLRKPFHVDRLLDAIKKALSSNVNG